ncbi:MAG: GTPase HflX [Saprospiraceae bacterium]
MKDNFSLNNKAANFKPGYVEKAVLVGVAAGGQGDAQLTEYLDELEFLASTAGAKVIKRFTQKLPHPDTRTFVGKGKLEEVREYAETHGVDLVIFDDDLSGKQTNNIEEALKVKVVDRSSLILDIFAKRAQTAQARTQVELAQLQYLLPRLRGLWTHLERQRGGIGMRGPGEQEVETDRRIVKEKIQLLKERLKKIDQQAMTQRHNRGELIRVALVGYTNVGKSTIMNLLSKSDILAENKLFATLDTTVRKVFFGDIPFLLSDTVGFIRKLPHHLVESFKSTLDEVRECDLLVHVVDISHPQYEDHINTVNKTLQEIKADNHPILMVFNKMDAYRDNVYDDLLGDEEKKELEDQLVDMIKARYNLPAVFISATQKENISELKTVLTRLIKELYVVRYPYMVKSW